jgi:hypothetical protein
VLAELAALKVPLGEAGKVVLREQDYFATHARRMNHPVYIPSSRTQSGKSFSPRLR